MGRPRKTPENDAVVARAVELHAKGVSTAVIAARLGTSRKNVDTWLRKAREVRDAQGA